jgi:hypothetical protein
MILPPPFPFGFYYGHLSVDLLSTDIHGLAGYYCQHVVLPVLRRDTGDRRIIINNKEQWKNNMAPKIFSRTAAVLAHCRSHAPPIAVATLQFDNDSNAESTPD